MNTLLQYGTPAQRERLARHILNGLKHPDTIEHHGFWLRSHKQASTSTAVYACALGLAAIGRYGNYAAAKHATIPDDTLVEDNPIGAAYAAALDVPYTLAWEVNRLHSTESTSAEQIAELLVEDIVPVGKDVELRLKARELAASYWSEQHGPYPQYCNEFVYAYERAMAGSGV